MNNKPDRLQEYSGVVVIIDALGIGQLSLPECRDFLEVRKLLLKYTDDLKQILQGKSLETFLDCPLSGPNLKTIGDTFIFSWGTPTLNISDTQYFKLFMLGLDWANDAIKEALQYNPSVKLRGAISVGEYIQDHEDDIIIGPAVFDASRIAESADWIGIIATQKTYERLKPLICDHDYSLFGIEYQVPLKGSSKAENKQPRSLKTVAGTWPLKFIELEDTNLLDDNFKQADEALKAYLEPPEHNQGVKAKYLNTIDFQNYTFGHLAYYKEKRKSFESLYAAQIIKILSLNQVIDIKNNIPVSDPEPSESKTDEKTT